MSTGWTLKALIDAGMSVTGGCLDCHRHQKLDLAALRDRFGADAPAMEWDLRPKMKCAVCGGKRITLTYSPDTSPKDLHRKRPQRATGQAEGNWRDELNEKRA